MLERVLEFPMPQTIDQSDSGFWCPKCGSHDVRRSKGEGGWAAFLRIFGRWPFRCRSCRARFFMATEPPEELD